MKTIVITRPAFFDGETDLVNSLFLEGMERLHLRKPGASEEELAAWLQDIDSQYYGRLLSAGEKILAGRGASEFA